MPSFPLRTLLLTSIAALLIVGGIALEPSAALADSKASTKTSNSKPRVAVLYFDHIGNDAELRFLRKGLTQMLITDLSDGSDLVVVERTDLEMVMKELKLNQSKFISRRSANKIGQMLGAQYLITGSYNNFRGTLHITAKVMHVELSTVEGVTKHGKVDQFTQLESELATGLRRTLAELSARKKISQKSRARARRNKRKTQQALAANKTSTKTAVKPPARTQASLSAQTVSRYGKALDSIDKGDKKLALKELGDLTRANPDFVLAADELKVLLR